MRNKNKPTKAAVPDSKSRKGPKAADSWILTAFNLGAFPPVELDIEDSSAVEAFRRNVVAEQAKVLRYWSERRSPSPNLMRQYLASRFEMFACPVVRAIYKLEMLQAVDEAFRGGLAATMLKRAVAFLWGRLDNRNLAAFYLLALAQSGVDRDDAKFVAGVCRAGLEKAGGCQPQVHCLPELLRVYAQALLDLGAPAEAFRQVRLAEESAARHPYYMPALWNRIYSCKSAIQVELRDEEGAAESSGRVSLNHRMYSDADNSDCGASSWLRWFSTRPPMVRPARP